MTLPRKEREARESACAQLLESAARRPLVAQGDRIYTVLRRRTPNGVNYLDFYTFLPYPSDGPRGVVKLRLTSLVARAIGARYDRRTETLPHHVGRGFDRPRALLRALGQARGRRQAAPVHGIHRLSD